jgi:hypothetical protein
MLASDVLHEQQQTDGKQQAEVLHLSRP